MNIDKMTEASYLGLVSAASTISGISVISVSGSDLSADESSQTVLLSRIGLSGISLGIVLGIMTAYLAVSAYLSTNRD